MRQENWKKEGSKKKGSKNELIKAKQTLMSSPMSQNAPEKL